MSGRRRYLAAYDIRDAKRLRRVHKVMKEFGWSMQYSVFICDLDSMELVEMKLAVTQELDHSMDAVSIVDLGDPAERGRDCFTFLGVAPRLPSAGPIVI